MTPSGVPIFNPPANGFPSGTEWQATQSPSLATYSASAAGVRGLPAGTDAKGLVGMRLTAIATTTTTANPRIAPTRSLFTLSPGRQHGACKSVDRSLAREPTSPLSQVQLKSCLRKGVVRTRLPVAWKIALPIAGPIGPTGGSPISLKRGLLDSAPKWTCRDRGTSAMRIMGYWS